MDLVSKVRAAASFSEVLALQHDLADGEEIICEGTSCAFLSHGVPIAGAVDMSARLFTHVDTDIHNIFAVLTGAESRIGEATKSEALAMAGILRSAGGCALDMVGRPATGAGRILCSRLNYLEAKKLLPKVEDLDATLQPTGLLDPHPALDIMRRADGAFFTASWLSSVFNAPVESFSAPEATAVRERHSHVVKIRATMKDGTLKRAIWKRTCLRDIQDNYTKPVAKMAKDITSYAVETSFYRLIAPDLPSTVFPVPHVFHVEGGAHPTVPIESSFCCLLEEFGDDYEQLLYLDAEKLSAALRAVARLHARFWNKGSEHLWPRGTFWVLDKRPEGEASLLPEKWEAATEVVREENPSFWTQPGIVQLGKRLKHWTAISSVELMQPKQGLTLIHGDFKTANLFYKKNTNEVAVIDYQWAGNGVCACDCAYLFLLSAEAAVLHQEEIILKGYYNALIACLEKEYGVDVAHAYPWSLFFHQYEMALVDYAKTVIGDQWNRFKICKELFAKPSWNQNLGRGAYNKSMAHAEWFIGRVSDILAKWETDGFPQ